MVDLDPKLRRHQQNYLLLSISVVFISWQLWTFQLSIPTTEHLSVGVVKMLTRNVLLPILALCIPFAVASPAKVVAHAKAVAHEHVATNGQTVIRQSAPVVGTLTTIGEHLF